VYEDGQRTTAITTTTQNIKLNVMTYNCQCYKQSSQYICKEILEHNLVVMCLNEIWLRPCELKLVPDVLKVSHCAAQDMTFSVFSKSGMVDAEPDYAGRPYGGVSIICKNNKNISYHELDVLSSRVIAVGLSSEDGALSQIIVNVYMPFYDKNCKKQT
jgi:hypothetical protein